MYWYVLVCTDVYSIYSFHQGTYLYIEVCTCTYAYIRVHAVSYPFQKGAWRSRTCDLLHTMHRVYHCVTGVQTSMSVMIQCDVSAFIICFCQTPWPGTWRLMTNQRCRFRRAAAASHDIPRPRHPPDLRVTEAQPRSGLGLNVLYAGGQKIESEWDSDLTVARFSVQRPTHLNAAESLGHMRHSESLAGPTTGTGIVIVSISTCGPGSSAMWVLSQFRRPP